MQLINYVLDPTTFGSTANVPANALMDANLTLGGVGNLTRCYNGAPILLSQAHFFGVSPEEMMALTRNIDVAHSDIRPDANLHTSKISIDKYTGLTVDAKLDLQVNTLTELPAGWPAEVSGSIPSAVVPVLRLKNEQTLPPNRAAAIFGELYEGIGLIGLVRAIAIPMGLLFLMGGMAVAGGMLIPMAIKKFYSDEQDIAGKDRASAAQRQNSDRKTRNLIVEDEGIEEGHIVTHPKAIKDIKKKNDSGLQHSLSTQQSQDVLGTRTASVSSLLESKSHPGLAISDKLQSPKDEKEHSVKLVDHHSEDEHNKYDIKPVSDLGEEVKLKNAIQYKNSLVKPIDNLLVSNQIEKTEHTNDNHVLKDCHNQEIHDALVEMEAPEIYGRHEHLAKNIVPPLAGIQLQDRDKNIGDFNPNTANSGLTNLDTEIHEDNNPTQEGPTPHPQALTRKKTKNKGKKRR